MSDFREIIRNFNIDYNAVSYGEGHINDTYLVDLSPQKYILQRINKSIFKNPIELMENVAAVTDYLKEYITRTGGDPMRETLQIIRTIDGKNCYKTSDGEYYRMYIFVEDTVTYQSVEKKEQFYNSALAFGLFQKRLADFPAEKLHETIPRFHDTLKRFNDLKAAIDADVCGRKKDVLPEIEFALAREDKAGIIVDALKSGEIPLRVTHNDTKLNNVLFDKETDKAICVIDLDTVMPGSLLYDYGDSIRFGASSGAEDERDLSKIYCDLELFEAYTKGYIEALAGSITEREIELLPMSAILMTYECGIRFLADHLSGDTYFRIHREGQNLDRARTQFKLVADMEQKYDQMMQIVRDCVNSNI